MTGEGASNLGSAAAEFEDGAAGTAVEIEERGGQFGRIGGAEVVGVHDAGELEGGGIARGEVRRSS